MQELNLARGKNESTLCALVWYVRNVESGGTQATMQIHGGGGMVHDDGFDLYTNTNGGGMRSPQNRSGMAPSKAEEFRTTPLGKIDHLRTFEGERDSRALVQTLLNEIRCVVTRKPLFLL
jgi:hypothetical protein